MKAVIMYSADKIEDDGILFDQGTSLGMERTVIKQDGTSNWFNSFAYGDGLEEGGEFDPLDDEMGVGHLNAKRAIQPRRCWHQPICGFLQESGVHG